jgi:hypothetical protein
MAPSAVLLAYVCSGRYGTSYSCSGFAYYGRWVAIGAAILAALVSHQGYRYRRGRGSVFGRRGAAVDPGAQDEAAARPADGRETPEEILARVRREAGLPPQPPPAGGPPGSPPPQPLPADGEGPGPPTG